MKQLKRTRHFYVFALVARLTVFLVLVFYALETSPVQFLRDLEAGPSRLTPVSIIWLALMVCMSFRLFPSQIESLGCQKIYRNRHTPTDSQPTDSEIKKADRGALYAFLFWVSLNAVFFLAYTFKIVDVRFMVCLAGFYSVADIICILFFCPFQAWMMHNRCCTTCRIFDWDYLMICTPLLAIPNPVTLSASALAGVIFLRWELQYARKREQFFESSNASLKCSQCQEHLCQYKRALAASVKPAKDPVKTRR